MKAKTIKAVLRKKIDALLTSIDDETVRNAVAKNTIVTGGCITSMLLKEPVNDFDLYFRNIETVRLVARYYVQKFKDNPPPSFADKTEVPIFVEEEAGRVRIVVKSAGIASENADGDYAYFEMDDDADRAAQYVGEIMTDTGEIADTYEEAEAVALGISGKPAYRPVFLSTNAITLSDKLQIILRFYGEPDTIHENYDFVHCTCFWRSWDGHLELRPAAMEAMLARELRYVGSKYPICSLIRLRKFIKRGWTINAGQILKISMQVSDLDLNDLNVLEDQLTGVDVAYFAEVVEKLRAKDEDRVESSYLLEIIDRMF